MARLFGTDGVRGQANTAVTADLALQLGRAMGRMLRDGGRTRPRVAVGHDPRWSSPMLDSAVSSGLASAGADVGRLGVVTSPVVAHAAASDDFDAGAMVSASHNPMADNGVKFFDHEGFKLTDDVEDVLETLLEDVATPPVGDQVGRIGADLAPIESWQASVVAAGTELAGLTVVLDAANGAASSLGPAVYRELGADVIAINAEPDGRNINEGCGSTHPEGLRRAVVEHDADVGVALDGDADRLVAVDRAGTVVDGDVILAILARRDHEHGDLARDTVATTVMTNLGFRHAMQRLGIDVEITRVGDRYVMDAMRELDLSLGGEQSGHLISLDHATTGDGILSGVRLLSTMADDGAGLHDLATVMTRLPQVLVNVGGVDKHRLAHAAHVESVIARVTERLGEDGRVLVRPSGTEPVIRVMVEAPTSDDATAAAEEIADEVRRTLART